MCDKPVLQNGATLESVPDCYKYQQMYDKAVGSYLRELKFVSDWYMTPKNKWQSCQYSSFYNKILSWMLQDSRNVW